MSHFLMLIISGSSLNYKRINIKMRKFVRFELYLSKKMYQIIYINHIFKLSLGLSFLSFQFQVIFLETL